MQLPAADFHQSQMTNHQQRAALKAAGHLSCLQMKIMSFRMKLK